MITRELTFLTLSEVWQDHYYKQLKVLDKYGSCALISDLAILTGGNFHEVDNKTRIGSYWTQSRGGIGFVVNAKLDGSWNWGHPDNKNISIRLVLKNYPYLSECYEDDGIKKINLGEYPQDIADSKTQEILKQKYYDKTLVKTSKCYHLPTGICEEYLYNGEKYICLKANISSATGKQFINNYPCMDGEEVFVKVSPIVWLIDEEKNYLISERCLLSGIPFDNESRYFKDFKETNVYRYINKQMVKDIFYKTDIKINGNDYYGFDYSQVSEEEILRGLMETNISAFLHGDSGDGKSARVKQLDPDCEIIYLRNATPDSLNGKSVYNPDTQEMIDIPPTWYKKIVTKCEQEPERIHIIFFDELSNALPSIQAMAFNIILNKEVNGLWKLPDNARIVAAGNNSEESLSANEIAEPLFNRFGHIYIKTTADDWLSWAKDITNNSKIINYQPIAEEVCIHPAIYNFISCFKDEVLRTKYNGETPNADPRKWEMASRLLYKTNKPEMLRSLIGDELTYEFIEFASRKRITIADIINSNDDNYEDILYKMNVSEKYALTNELAMVNEDSMPKIRNFVAFLGAEFVILFDKLWVGNDNSRKELIIAQDMNIPKIRTRVK